MTFKRILDVVDNSYGFIKKGCDLPVGANGSGAEEIIEPTNDFFSQITPKTFDFAVFKLDTHFSIEYALSPESVPFPNIHCEYGTEGWTLAVDPDLIEPSTPVFFMAKNTFDMWGDNPIAERQLLSYHKATNFDDLPFKSADEKVAYKNLYHVTNDPVCLEQGIHRDEFFEGVDEETEVVMIGVATNFCDADAIYGYLQRSATVTVLENLVKGIPLGAEGRKAILELSGIDRTENGTVDELFATDRFRLFVESGKLRKETSADFLLRVQPDAPATFYSPSPL
jgi:nicotinamidase-related amidase